MNEVDKRVVQMEFDNAKFEKNIDQTMKTLEDLNKMLQMNDASKGFDSLIDDSDKFAKSMDSVGASVDDVKFKLSALQIVGYTVLSELTKTAIKVGNKMASAVWSPIVAGGSRRAQNIEAAKFQLEGLGVAWKDISDDINYGVKDTAYGLDSAARVAAQLVASNIKPGELMRDTLRGISGVAAMTNSSYDEIGSIFTTVAGNNKLMTMQLRQLSYRGLNAAATLGNYLGKTEQEIYEMVSKGKIDFETFANAMDDAFGEHAKEANKTFSGAMSNVNAALSRVGAKFADPVYDNLRQIFVALIPVINGVNRIIDPVVDGFSNLLDLIRISTTSLFTEDFSKAIGMLFLDIYSWIRPLIGALTKVGILGRDLNGVGTGLLGVLSKLQLYGSRAEKVEHFIMGIFGVIKLIYTIIKSIITIVKPVFEWVIFGLGKIFGITGDFGEVLWGVSNVLSVLIQKLAEIIALKIGKTLSIISAILKTIDLNKVANGIILIVNVLGMATKAVFALSKVTILLIAGLISAIPMLLYSLTGVLGTIGNIYDTFTSKIYSIFGGRKRTANLEVNTSLNGPSAESIVHDQLLTEDVFEKSIVPETTLSKYRKNIDKTSESVRAFGEVSKNAAINTKNNTKAVKDELESISKASKDTASKVNESSNAAAIGQAIGGRNNPEQEAAKSPIVRFFITLRNYIIIAGMALVAAIVTVVGWIADAINKVFPSLGALGAAVVDKLTDIINTLDPITAIFYSFDLLIFGLAASIVSIFMSVSTLISGAGLYLGGIGIAAALGAFESAIWSILMFLTAIALITEFIDLDKFNSVIDTLDDVADGSLKLYVLGFIVINLLKMVTSISPLLGIAALINSLTLGLSAVMISLILFDKILPNNMGSLYKKVAIIIGISAIGLALVLAAIWGFVKLTGLSVGSETKTGTNIGGLRDLFGSNGQSVFSTTTTTTNSLGGIIGLITGLGLYLAAVAVAMKLASSMSWKEIGKGGAVIGGALLLLAGTISLIGLAYKKVNKTWDKTRSNVGIDTEYNPTKKSKKTVYEQNETFKNVGSRNTEASPMAEIANVISAIGGYILRITLAMKIISKMSWGEIKKGAAVLGGALAAIGVLLAVLAKFTKTIDSSSTITHPFEGSALNRRDNTETTIKGSKTESNMGAIAAAIKSISGFLLSVTLSIAVLSRFSKGELTRAAVTIGAVMLVMAAIVGRLSFITSVNANAADNVGKIISKMSLLLLAIAVSLVLVSKQVKKEDLSAKKLGLILGFFAGTIVMIGVILGLCRDNLLSTINVGAMTTVIIGIVAILAALALSIAVISSSDLKKMQSTFKDVILPLLITMGVVLAALLVIGYTGNMMVASLPVMWSVIGALGGLLIAIAGAVAILAESDLDNLSRNINTISGFILLITGIFAIIASIASIGITAGALFAAAGAFTVMTLFVAALGVILNFISKIDMDQLETGVSAISNLTLTLGALFTIFSLIASSGIGALGMITAAGAFVIMSGALLAIAAAIDTLAKSDVDSVKRVGDTLVEVILSIGAAAVMVGIGIGIATGVITGSIGLIVVVILALIALLYYVVDQVLPNDILEGVKSFFGSIIDTIELVVSVLDILIDKIKEFKPLVDVLQAAFNPIGTTHNPGDSIFEDIYNYAEDASRYGVGSFILELFRGGNPNAQLKPQINPNAIANSMQNMSGMTNNRDIEEKSYNSGIKYGKALIAGLYSTLTSSKSKDKVQDATNNLIDTSAAIDTNVKSISNMSKILDEYGSSISKNITDRNREAIETTKELANSINNSSESMKSFSKATGDSSNISALTKEIGVFNKEVTDISTNEEITKNGFDVGKNVRGGIKAGLFEDVTEDVSAVFGWLKDVITDAGSAAGSWILDHSPSWVQGIFTGDMDVFGDLGFDLGSYAGMIGGEQMMEMFGIYSSTYYEKLAAQASQGITASQRALDEIKKSRQSDIYALGRAYGAIGKYEDVINWVIKTAEEHPASVVAMNYADIMRKYDANEAKYSTAIGTYQGQLESANTMANATIYDQLGLPDISDLFNNTTTGMASNYTNDAASSIASSSGSGSGINDASMGSGNTNINSNNTYNFTQNNYSPEALSRSDLYLQTRAQINAWYGWMRAQPAT